MSEKILYFGAGTYLEPINHFYEINNFVLVDSLPKNEYGFDYYSKLNYRKDFLFQLEKKIKDNNLILIEKKVLTNNFSEINVKNLESECLYLTNANLLKKNIKYYTSTSIPNNLYDNYQLQQDIESCDSLLICGYMPHIKIINYIKKPFNFIGYSGTYFPKNIYEYDANNTDNENTILPWVLTNPHSIKNYILVNRDNGEKYYYSSYQDFYEKLTNI